MRVPELVRRCVRTVAGPAIDEARAAVYAVRFHQAYERLKKQTFAPRLRLEDGVSTKESQPRLWNELQASAPEGTGFQTLALGRDRSGLGGEDFFARHEHLYTPIGHGREKALEHSLTFELFDFSRVRRYCDVASGLSPIAEAFRRDLPGVEYWKQDSLFETNLGAREIGGLAQDMAAIPKGFFDAMALHCSYEHFNGAADGAFVKEVGRVLSPSGACLILPLYVDGTPSIFFDPTMVTGREVTDFDAEADLRAAYAFRQSHGRHYSPRTLEARVLSRVPAGLRATLVQVEDQTSIGDDIYLRFALVLHRPESVFRDRS